MVVAEALDRHRVAITTSGYMYTDWSTDENGNLQILRWYCIVNIVNCIVAGHKQDYGNALSNFIQWYDENFLEWNVDQTKKL